MTVQKEVNIMKHSPGFKGSVPPEEASRDVLNLAYVASSEEGDSGSFVDHWGTKRWM